MTLPRFAGLIANHGSAHLTRFDETVDAPSRF